ncbi:MAG: dipeptidase [Candidatus Limnocylindrales bacterium]
MIDRIVDRLLNRTVAHGPLPVSPEVAAFHASIPVVDLLVGTPLFRRGFLARIGHGHVDLPRAREGGLDVIDFSIATRFPNLRGTLSAIHFRALGVPPRRLHDDMAIVETFLDRIDGWIAASDGRLRWFDPAVPAPGPGEPISCFAGIQGGHALGGDLRNIERLQRRGVRMLALAHVMDTPLAGSGSGRLAGGLTGLGREAIAELERVGVVVDLAHASVTAIREALPLLHRPFAVSHTGFTALAGGRSWWRRYSPATRNLPDDVVRDVGQAGGLVGVTLATDLVGGITMSAVVRSFSHAVRLAGPERVALGSDFDGALRMPFDVTGLPALTGALLDAGLSRPDVAGIMGGNALRLLSAGPAT